MRIGISVLTFEGQNIWSNGLGQNVFHLGRVLQSIPFVTDVVLLNCGDQATLSEAAAPGFQTLRLVKPREATDLIDVAIELGGGLDLEWLDYIRARGKKVVFYECGHPYTGRIEAAVFGKSAYFSRPERCDELWILPSYKRFKPMLGALHRCPIREIPYLWAPTFLERRSAELDAHGLKFGFGQALPATPPRPFRAAIFEPNISVTKAASIPMLICDEAYRRDRTAINSMHVLCSLHMTEHRTFNFLANSLDIVKDGKGLFLGRHDFAAHMAGHADIVVSHQWEHDRNYLYLDALYGGYPIVHNSPWLGGAGYYYPDSDIESGAQQFLAAVAHHADNIETYRANAARFIAALSPDSKLNQDHYARRLLALESSSQSRRTA